MAKRQREDENIHIKNGNYTRIHNKILEALMKTHLSGYEIKIILAIWRKVYGWRKKEDFITFKQFQQMTNLPKSEVSRTLARLKRRNIVVKNYNSRPVKYKFNKYFTKWKELEKSTTVVENYKRSCRKLHKPMEKSTTKKSQDTSKNRPSSVPKETITKETTTKEKDIKERTMMWSQIKNLLSQFPEEIKDMVDEYIELARLENKTKRITLQKRRRLINELHLLWTSCDSSITQKDFEKALRTTINNEAPSINYVRKVMKGIMRKRSVRLKRGRNGHT